MNSRISVLAGAMALWLLAGLVWLAPDLSGEEPRVRSVVQRGPQPAERLVIEYKDGAFALLSRTEVTKVIPPSVALPDAKGQVYGCWFEAQDDGGAVLYRRRMSSPRIVYTEYPADDDSGAIVREEAAVSSRTFSILVPRHAKIQAVAFYDSERDDQKRAQAASEVGRLTLR